MKKKYHILIIPSWYPKNKNDVSGVFFRDQAIALANSGNKVGVIAPIFKSLKKLKSYEKVNDFENDCGIATYRRRVLAIPPKINFLKYLIWKYQAKKMFEVYIKHEGVPEVIHAHSSLYAGLFALYIKEKYNIPFVITEHSSGFVRNIYDKWQLRVASRVFTSADKSIVVSDALGGFLKKNLDCKSVNFHWIPNVVSPRFFDQNYPQKKSTNFSFVNVALMEENKRQLMLIEAFAKAFSSNENVFLNIGGDGPLMNTLKLKAEYFGIKKQINFLGRILPENVPLLLNNSDVMVISSEYETFGVVAAEALALGLPVVSTSCGGPESFINKGDGLILKNNTIEELSNTLKYIYKNINSFDSMEIKKNAKKRFHPDSISAQLEEVYKEILK